ncbi:EAL domain-containing protein [Massilia niabensis]|uniref:EAL domain-containing protein n=1 Tax=Massilia niabensis TaxID=544910 RepID=A0ABW0L576_9BURK
MLPAATVATLLAGLLVSLLLFSVLHEFERTRSAYDFTRRVEAHVAVVTRSFEDAAVSMRATNLLFRSSAAVDDAQFARFTAPLLDFYPYIRGLAYFRFVRDDQRAAYEAERNRAWPGFHIRERSGAGFVPAPRRPLYLVLDKVAPRGRNTHLRGYDAWAHPPHRAVVQRIIDTGQPLASELIPLIEPRGRLGNVLFLPVYGTDKTPDTVTARRAATTGVTEVIIDVGALVHEKLLSVSLLARKDIGLTLSGPAPDGRSLLEVVRYASVPPDEPAWLGRLLGAAEFRRTQRFTVAGQPWELAAHMREPASAHVGSVAMLVIGIAFSVAAAAYVHAGVTRARQVETLVGVRTADLWRASEALRLYHRAIESSANAVILVDARTEGYPVIYVNPAFERMRRRKAEDVIGHPMARLTEDAPDQPGLHELRNAMRERREGHSLLFLRRGDGTGFYCDVYLAPIMDANGNTDHFVIAEYDVTTAKQYEAELERRARHDTLTGLPNRVLLADRIERAMAAAAGYPGCVWVVALDLDHFKDVNDSLGHAAGDRLLRQASARIAAAIRPTDTVARTGDDEFVLLLVERGDECQVLATVDEVLAAVAAPYTECGQRIHITCSAGVAGYPADGEDADTLVKHAEIAMVRAKEGGRNLARFYLPGMNERARERLALVDAMRVALASNQFELHYQPQIDLAAGRAIGMEALIRWRHPQHGLMRPDRFITLAEETGLIVPMGAWALRSACAQAVTWQAAGFGPLRVAVNLSARQFQDPALPAMIGAVLRETGLSPRCLELEVTESLMMDDVEVAIVMMKELKAMGVRLSIDDFGTGYSSLAYLKCFPVDVLKIDQSFVRDIEHDPDNAAMVAAIISLSHDLGMRVIAEGVETPAQRDFLARRDCDEVQGYLYSRPVPAAEFECLLQAARVASPLPRA